MNVSIRPAAVAGAFYPDSAPALENIVSLMLMKAPRGVSSNPKAIIVPHAGYIYSGTLPPLSTHRSANFATPLSVSCCLDQRTGLP